MKTIKTAEAEGPVLDWLAAKCEDFRDDFAIIRVWNNRVTKIIPGDYETSEVYTSYSPSADWAQGGPIIERERIAIAYEPSQIYDDSCRWKALWIMGDHGHDYGPTPLIAAMRCYVTSKLGDEVEVPEEL